MGSKSERTVSLSFESESALKATVATNFFKMTRKKENKIAQVVEQLGDEVMAKIHQK